MTSTSPHHHLVLLQQRSPHRLVLILFCQRFPCRLVQPCFHQRSLRCLVCTPARSHPARHACPYPALPQPACPPSPPRPSTNHTITGHLPGHQTCPAVAAASHVVGLPNRLIAAASHPDGLSQSGLHECFSIPLISQDISESVPSFLGSKKAASLSLSCCKSCIGSNSACHTVRIT